MKSARANFQILSRKDTATRTRASSWVKSHRTAWQRHAPNANFACRSICHSPRLALHGIEADFGHGHADTFRRDLQFNFEPRTSNFAVRNGADLNDSDRFPKDDEVRWQFGVPPKRKANFAWVQCFIHHPALGDPALPWTGTASSPLMATFRPISPVTGQFRQELRNVTAELAENA